MQMIFNNRVKLQLRELLTTAAHFYADKLGLDKKLQDKIELEILVRKGSDRGACYTNCSPKRVPTYFTIELNPDDDISILQTLAHEMVHLKQFATGELRLMSKCNKLKDKTWKKSSNEMDDYYDSPWEIEAFGREEGLFLRFAVEHCSDEK